MRQSRYQGLVKDFSRDDDISSWFRNLEYIVYDKNIPNKDWAFMPCKNLSGEPRRIIESVPDGQLNDFDYLKQRICQHFSVTDQGHQEKFRNL